MPSLNNNDFEFLVHSNNPQRDQEQIAEFLDVVNRNYMNVFSDFFDAEPLQVDYITMRAITKMGNNRITSTLKSAENLMLTNNNDEALGEFHASRVVSECRNMASGSIQKFVNNLLKMIRFGEQNPDNIYKTFEWNIVYYAGLRKGGIFK